jgi:hypothetical protein
MPEEIPVEITKCANCKHLVRSMNRGPFEHVRDDLCAAAAGSGVNNVACTMPMAKAPPTMLIR